MSVANVEVKKNEYGYAKWSGGNDGHIVVTVRGHSYALRVSEEKVPARQRWEANNREYTWTAAGRSVGRVKGRYDANGTGRLTVALITRAREGRAASWSDRSAWMLDDKLPAALQELEVRAAEDDHAQLEAERAAQERQRVWEIELERAKARFMEHDRAKALRSQVTAWQEAQLLTTYLDALRGTHGSNPASSEWIDWIEKYIARLNPLTTPPGMPAEPEISREDLKPFMPSGMSPYGPSRW